VSKPGAPLKQFQKLMVYFDHPLALKSFAPRDERSF
jgi:hypothetical protein